MGEEATKQLVLAFENYLSGLGFGQEGLRSAQERGWVDRDGRVTDAGVQLCQSLAEQAETRSVFRNCA